MENRRDHEFQHHQQLLFKEFLWDFPGDPVVKNPPCYERDTGSIPVWGTKIPHALPQLRPNVAKKIK